MTPPRRAPPACAPADQLAFDAAAPGVRAAVLEGLRQLVDNVHAQPVLRRALPGLAPLVNDAAPAVRVAMADLLLCVSTSRGLKFWEVRQCDAPPRALGRAFTGSARLCGSACIGA